MTNEDFIKSISLEGEIWKDVVGYEGHYSISSFGRLVCHERYITAKNYSTFIFPFQFRWKQTEKPPLVCLLLCCFASASLRDRTWLAKRDSNHTFGCTSPRPKPLDD